jgi:hypothetical protein
MRPSSVVEDSHAPPFVVQIDQAFVPGTHIEFVLAVATAQGSTTLPFTQATGTPIATTIFSENFDGVPPGAFPLGWSTSHGGGANVVPWTTSDEARDGVQPGVPPERERCRTTRAGSRATAIRPGGRAGPHQS